MAKDRQSQPYHRRKCCSRMTAFVLALWPVVLWADCDPWAAKLVAIEGTVELRASDAAAWTPAGAEALLCPGASVRVGEYGRAAVMLQDNTLLRLDARSTLTLPPDVTPGGLLDLLEGAVHFISRVTRGLTVRTPFVNAGVEGTEFLVQVTNENATVIVFEGTVRAVNAAGEVALRSGEAARVSAGQAPVLDIPVKPRDAVHWALYYPPVLSFTPEAFATSDEQSWQRRVAQSIALYRNGELAQAHAALADIDTDIPDSRFYTYRASLSLAVGQVERARRDIDRALMIAHVDADAIALKSIIAIVQNEREAGLALAQQAIAAAPTAVGPHLAWSYALQASFRLDEARTALQHAVTVAPQEPLLWSRLAELQLMFRDLAEARRAAERASELAPHLAHTQTVLGFAQLIALNVDEARATFTHAIALDQSAPLPHLGLGLSLIRAGELEAGRRELELAAILNPSEGLIRSYLGKAYYEERRHRLAGDQYDMAKQLDQLDPTPWFYAAILKQTENQPIAALEDLQRAIALNDNRAVYRSRWLLDEDAAARSASLARIYDSLGFRQWALSESRKSLSIDPANASAHRFLADSYADVPRHQIARASELLQTHLLQPAIVAPVSPSAGEAKLLDFEGTGPSSTGFNEFSPLLQRERFSLLASGIYGSNDTQGGELAAGMFFDRGALSAGRYQQRTDGVRENNDRDVTINNVFAQLRITSEISLLGEYRRKEGEFGDTNLLFDFEEFSRTLRRSMSEEHWRFGLRYVPLPKHTVLFTAGSGRLADETKASSLLTLTGERDSDAYEGQYLWQGTGVKSVAGMGYLNTDEQVTTKIDLSAFQLPPQTTSTNQDLEQNNGYLYIYIPVVRADWIVGAAYDSVDQQHGVNEEQISPKLGVVWQVRSNTQFRAAAFRALKRRFLQDQTIEPTQVAGFNQFFDDQLGTDAWRYGMGLDTHFGTALMGGVETSKRDITRLLLGDDGNVTEEDGSEWLHRIYLYWHSSTRTAVSAEYRFEDFERDFIPGREDSLQPASMATGHLPWAIHYFHDSGVYARLQTSHVKQDVTYVLAPSGTASNQDSFWVADAILGYRFPKRRGFVEVSGRNLTDNDFHYQSVDPGPGVALPSPYYPDAAFFLNFQLWL